MTRIGEYTKAVLTAVAMGVGPYIAAVRPESQGGVAVSTGELLTIVGAVLVGTASVWRADNVRWFAYAKSATSAAAQLLAQLSVLLLAGQAVGVTEVLQALLAVGVTFGVVAISPNAERSDFHDPIGSDDEDEPDDTPTPDAEAAAHADLDKDGDGRDDKTGRFLPGHGLSMILGGHPYGRDPLVFGGPLHVAP